MNNEEFFRWFHGKYLPLIHTHTHEDWRYYRDMVTETLSFMTQTGSCYSNLNYACILAAWANEGFMPTLSRFEEQLENMPKDYWDGRKDTAGICPVDGVDYMVLDNPEPMRNFDRFNHDRNMLVEACLRERGLLVSEDFKEVFLDWLFEPYIKKED